MKLGNKGVFPINRWFAALILLFTVYITYGVTSDIVENILPDAYNAQSFATASGAQNVQFTKNNFVIGTVLLFAGGLFFILFAGIPFQREDIIQ